MSERYADRITAENFAEWYRKQEWGENIREGQPYFNGPSPVPPSEKHSPSSLLQCHRKVVYRQENAPAEREKPEGIFWWGTRFEEDVVVPYLRDVVYNADAYVRNSLWVDFEVATETGTLRFKGATDPCIVDRQSEPILPTEVKTKKAVAELDGPNRHHRAQVHAYMRGLAEKYDREIDEAVIIYGSRKTLNLRAFTVAFDDTFWQAVVEWASRHTEYRETDELPPADPEYGWECHYCDYRHRCGQSDEPYSDEGPHGFLLGFANYPRKRVAEYLQAHGDAILTPTLAREYPDLAEKFDVQHWSCSECGEAFEIGEVELPEPSRSPVCPKCADAGELATLVLARPETSD